MSIFFLSKRFFIIQLMLLLVSVSISIMTHATGAPTRSTNTFVHQVEYCKEHLPVANLPPEGSCFGNNTKEFVDGSEIKRLGYFKLDDDVDAVFHCDTKDVEMIVHNRKTGNTCFFFMPAEKTDADGSFPSIDSCTSIGCSAGVTWIVGDDLEANGQCTTCHRHGGPYFIVNSAEAMAHFGLINNGHDTHFDKYFALHVDSARQERMNSKIQVANPKLVNISSLTTKERSLVGCGASCHSFVHEDTGQAPGIPFSVAFAMTNLGMMPPNDPQSPYRWVNRDGPGGSGDHERFSDVQDKYPALATCATPGYMEAHVVGSEHILRSDSVWASLRAFNPVDGLICKNEDMPDGKCPNFQVRFKCSYNILAFFGKSGFDVKMWADWQDKDTPDETGDHEYPNKCTNPTEIEARIATSGSSGGATSTTARGFPDRLRQFDNKGLVCKNKDQADGECSNYVVRFVCP